MPVKISKKTRKTKGKGKLSQSQQVIVNIQKGKRKSTSQPVIRTAPAPIIIQQPQQDFSQLENLFRQYSTSRSVIEPTKVPEKVSFETQTEQPVMMEKKTQVGTPAGFDELLREKEMYKMQQEKEKLRKKLSEFSRQAKDIFQEYTPIKQTPIKQEPMAEFRTPESFSISESKTPDLPSDKVINPETNRMIKVGSNTYKKLQKKGYFTA